MTFVCRAISGLIVIFFLCSALDSIPPPASEGIGARELRAQYRLLIEERNRLLKRNRFLAMELRLALSNALYLVIHSQPPVIQLKTQATPLEEYEVDDLDMDQALWDQISAEGVVQLSVRDLRETSSDSRLERFEPRWDPEEDRSTSAVDSSSSKPETLYVVELDQRTSLYVQRSTGGAGDAPEGVRSLLKNVIQGLTGAWKALFARRRRMYVAVDEQDARRLFRLVRVGMHVLLVE